MNEVIQLRLRRRPPAAAAVGAAGAGAGAAAAAATTGCFDENSDPKNPVEEGVSCDDDDDGGFPGIIGICGPSGMGGGEGKTLSLSFFVLPNGHQLD
jgi:hypothetical protein